MHTKCHVAATILSTHKLLLKYLNITYSFVSQHCSCRSHKTPIGSSKSNTPKILFTKPVYTHIHSQLNHTNQPTLFLSLSNFFKCCRPFVYVAKRWQIKLCSNQRMKWCHQTRNTMTSTFRTCTPVEHR